MPGTVPERLSFTPAVTSQGLRFLIWNCRFFSIFFFLLLPSRKHSPKHIIPLSFAIILVARLENTESLSSFPCDFFFHYLLASLPAGVKTHHVSKVFTFYMCRTKSVAGGSELEKECFWVFCQGHETSHH